MQRLKRLIDYVRYQTPYQVIEYGYGQLTVRIDEREYSIDSIDNGRIREYLTELQSNLEKLQIQEIIIKTT